MARTNPFKQIREGVIELLIAANIEGLKWIKAYDGEAVEDDREKAAFRLVVQRAANKGAGAFLSLEQLRREPDENEGWGWDASACMLRFLIAASHSAGRQESAETAEQILWDIYATLHAAAAGAAAGAACLVDRWRFEGSVIEYQTTSTTVMSLFMRNRVHIGLWEES